MFMSSISIRSLFFIVLTLLPCLSLSSVVSKTVFEDSFNDSDSEEASTINTLTPLTRFKDNEKLDAALFLYRDETKRITLLTPELIGSSYNSKCLSVIANHMSLCLQKLENPHEGISLLSEDTNALHSLIRRSKSKISLSSFISFIKKMEEKNFSSIFNALSLPDSTGRNFFHHFLHHRSKEDGFLEALKYLSSLVGDAISIAKDEEGNSVLHYIRKKEFFEAIFTSLTNVKKDLNVENNDFLIPIQMISKKDNSLREFLLSKMDENYLEIQFLKKILKKGEDSELVSLLLERIPITLNVFELILSYPSSSSTKQKERINSCLSFPFGRKAGQKWDFWKEDEVMGMISRLSCDSTTSSIINDFFSEQKWQSQYGGAKASGKVTSSLHYFPSSNDGSTKKKCCPIQCPISKEYRWGSLFLIVLVIIFLGLWRRNSKKLKTFN